jgi:hypothetical protein
VFFHPFAHRTVRFDKDLRHEKQGRPNVEAMSLTQDAIAASSWPGVLFQYRDLETGSGKAPSRGDTCDPCTYHNYILSRGHLAPPPRN